MKVERRSLGPTPHSGGEGAYLSLLDGVRGCAAIAILFYHYVHFFMAGPSRRPPGDVEMNYPAYDFFWLFYDRGYLAVQVFWLISGFVFCHVYHGRAATTRSFVVNRLARLYPLHILTLFVVVAFQLAALRSVGYTPIYGKFDLEHFAPQLFMASAWLREPGGHSFNGPVWSVSVEIVIYAFFWSGRGLISRMGLPLVMALVAGFYFAHQQLGEISMVFACGFYFFLGCGYSILRQSKLGQGRGLSFSVVLLAALGMWGIVSGTDWSSRYIAVPGLCGAIFLLLAVGEANAPAMLRRICQWLGENTYGAYLWHFPLQLALLLILIPHYDPYEIAQNGWFLAFYVFAVVAIARLSFTWFERPMRDRLRRRFGRSAQAVRLGAP